MLFPNNITIARGRDRDIAITSADSYCSLREIFLQQGMLGVLQRTTKRSAIQCSQLSFTVGIRHYYKKEYKGIG